MYDYIILGGGLGGIQLGYYFEKSKMNYLILEKSNRLVNFFTKYPRHRTLISINKVYTGSDDKDFNLRHDWNSLLNDEGINFSDVDKEYFPNADSILSYINNFTKNFPLNVKYNTEIVDINKDNLLQNFELKDQNNDIYECKKLIVVTGLFTQMIPHDIRGMEYSIGYDKMTIDKEFYKNKSVMIIGNGNSAFETANYLNDITSKISIYGRRPPRLSWQTHYVGDIRGINNTIIDSYQLKSINVVQEATGYAIIKNNNGTYSTTENETKEYDIVINCTGFKFDYNIFNKNLRPEMYNHKYPSIKPNFESVNIKNLYFGGTLMHGLDYKKSTLGFIHGFRYGMRFLYEYLNSGCFRTKKVKSNQIVNHILKRCGNTSCLYQLFTTFCDIYIISKNLYIYELPVEYLFSIDKLKDIDLKDEDIITIHFEYGFKNGENTLDKNRVTRDIYNGYTSKFLHPVINFYPRCENHLSRKSKKPKILCVCGRWEDYDIMKNRTLCNICSNKSICSCGSFEYNNYLSANIFCKKCRKDCIIQEDTNYNPQIEDYIYSHHIMEDLEFKFENETWYEHPLLRFYNSITKKILYDVRYLYVEEAINKRAKMKNELKHRPIQYTFELGLIYYFISIPNRPLIIGKFLNAYDTETNEKVLVFKSMQ